MHRNLESRRRRGNALALAARRSARDRSRLKLTRFLALLLLLLALCFGAAWIPVRQARHAWLSGHNSEAIAIARQWSSFPLWPRQYHQILALSYLSAGNEAAARPHLAAIGDVWLSAIDKGSVARRFFATGKDAAFLEYDAASHDRRESADAPLYRAAALTGINRLTDAASVLRSIDASKVDARKYAVLRAAVEQRLSGSAPFVFDRQDHPIAVYRPATNDVVSTDEDFAALIDRQAGDLTIGARLPQLG